MFPSCAKILIFDKPNKGKNPIFGAENPIFALGLLPLSLHHDGRENPTRMYSQPTGGKETFHLVVSANGAVMYVRRAHPAVLQLHDIAQWQVNVPFLLPTCDVSHLETSRLELLIHLITHLEMS